MDFPSDPPWLGRGDHPMATRVVKTMVHRLPSGRPVQLLVDEVVRLGLRRAIREAGFDPDERYAR